MADQRALIDPDKCDKSPRCPARKACPAQAIEQEEPGEPFFVNPFCQGCGKCVIYCPQKAIKMI